MANVADNLKRVLAAEDNAALLGVVRFNLEKAGFEVQTARNGRLAWEALEQSPFDLVVTDQQMPELTGEELCRRMRSDARFVDVPVIMLTAKCLELNRAMLRDELRIFEVLSKPFSPRELVQTVHACLADHATAQP